MTWILWTIGWFLAVHVAVYLSDKVTVGTNPILITKEQKQSHNRKMILYTLIWIIGMVKFW